MYRLILNAWLAVLLCYPLVILAESRFEVSDRGEYVGARTCAECHRAQFDAWRGSHHDLAMQPATPETVLGNFNDVRFSHNGVESRFFRRDGRYMVRTDGPDGKLRDYPVAYTFGVTPLQQYLIEFPGGRLQPLGIAWDSRPKDQGGQRWFHLYPGQKVDHRHPLHWTSPNQTWNHQCAECHSTDLKKNYDARTHSYHTTWKEIDVACEACHGPGKAHVKWARSGAKAGNDGLKVHFHERRGVGWPIDAKTGNAKRSKPRTNVMEIELCARCHSRRSLLSEDYHHGQPLTQTHRPALLSEGLYYPDGQIQDEVYVYGSFLQSRMYHAGVTCSDCHDPHTLKLRGGVNGVCLQCHKADKFDTPKHHHHAGKSAGAACVGCHMPQRPYMVVDPRRDHSLRIPRPDLSVTLGTPNACNNCHRDKNTQWASDTTRKWYGSLAGSGFQSYAAALREGRRDGPGAARLLSSLGGNESQPAIARATAVSLLPRYLGQATFATLQAALMDDHAMIRLAAVGGLERLPVELKAVLGAPLLSDPQLAIRIEAARVLADVSPDQVGGKSLAAALKEYLASQRLNADRPEAWVNLANLARRQGKAGEAEHDLREAIAIDPTFTPAYVNLADLYRAMGKETEGLEKLQQGLATNPRAADLHHALGLSRIRLDQRDKALASLKEAAGLVPDNARYAFVYAVALDSLGHRKEAIQELELALKQHPTDRDILFTLLQYHLESGDHSSYQELVRRFRQSWPNDPRSRQLVAPDDR